MNTSILRERLDRVHRAARARPTLVAVDFAEQGDLLGVVDATQPLNRGVPSAAWA